MKKIMVIGIVSVFLLTAFPSHSTTGVKINVESVEKFREDIMDAEIDSMFVPRELIVKFKDNINIYNLQDGTGVTGITSIDMLSKTYGVKSADKLFKTTKAPSLFNIYKLVLSDAADVLPAAESYSKDSNIEYAEPNYIYRTCNIPNDPYFTHQWALNQSNDYDIDAPEAWDIETGISDVIIAIIDSGVDYNHIDLADNIWINTDEIIDGTDTDGNGYVDDIRGYDFVDNAYQVHPDEDGEDRDNDPIDFHGHGTHCAGITAAVGNNSEGIAGVSWNSKIMCIRCGYKSSEGGGLLNLESVALGVSYAVDNGADVISMSFGGPSASALQEDVIKMAYDRGVVLVASAGNENINKKSYPAAFDEVIAVAATNKDDDRAFFSNYGDWVDVAAPGVDICSTFINNSYVNYSGTSMAGPHVAGLAALIKSKNKQQGPNKIREIIHYSIDRLEPTFQLKRGRINARNALQRGTGSASAIIKTPKHGIEVKGVIEIKGIASGEEFQNYTMEYSKGRDPETTEWTEINKFETPVQNGELCSLDSNELEEGIHIIRLKLFCTDGVYTDTIWILVNNNYNWFIVDDDGGADYTSIQDAVYDSGNGDKIYVKNGTYIELITIFKSIDLMGEDKDNTVIDGGNNGSVIYIQADNVNISGFTIKNCSVFCSGIFLDNSQNCIISCNNIERNFIGIKLEYSEKNTIHKNNLRENTVGIRVAKKSNKNVISCNNFINDHPRILYVHASYRKSYFNRWKNNYWDDWIGLRSIVFRLIPKRIPHRFIDNPLFFTPAVLHRCNFDWRPASKPHEIPPSGIIYYPGGA